MVPKSNAFLISIDLGTSSIRVALTNNELKVIFLKQFPVSLQMDGLGKAVQDADEIIKLALDGLSTVLKWADANQVKPIGICFSNASASLVGLDEDFQPLAPALTYLDLRSRAQAENLLALHGSDAFRFTGAPVHASYWLPKFQWLAATNPAVHKAAYFCTIKDLLVYRLTGQFMTDVANAGADGMCDVRTMDWDPKLLKLAGIERGQLPQVAPTTAILDLAPVVNIPELRKHSDLKIILGAMDGLLASLGAGAFLPGQVTTTIGSSGACRVAARMPLTEGDPLLIWSYPLDKDIWFSGGAMNNGGLVTKWLVENFSLSGIADERGYEAFFSEAASVNAGAEGLIFLPYLYGERAPIYTENARGVFFGLTAQHKRAHFSRAGLEGILFALYSIYTIVQPAGNSQPIQVTGGYLKSDLLLQIQADIFGVTIETRENLEGSVIGAAMVGMKALGVIRDYQDVTAMLPVDRVFLPDEQNHKTYQHHYKRFKKLHEIMISTNCFEKTM